MDIFQVLISDNILQVVLRKSRYNGLSNRSPHFPSRTLNVRYYKTRQLHISLNYGHLFDSGIAVGCMIRVMV